MLAIWGAQAGMSMMKLTKASELTPKAKPNRAMPMGSPIAMSEPKARSRMTIATTTPMSSPALVWASSKAKKRSPPVSTWRGSCARASAATSFNVARSLTLRLSAAGYCTRTSAMRPSGETVSVVPSTWGRSKMPVSTWVSAARSTGWSNVAESSTGVMTTCAVRPPLSVPVDWRSSVAVWESSPGTLNEFSISLPKVADTAMTSTDTASQAPITRQACVAANLPQRNRYVDMLLTPRSDGRLSGGHM